MYEDGDDDDDDDCDDKDDISSLIAEVERGCAPPTLNHGIDTEVNFEYFKYFDDSILCALIL